MKELNDSSTVLVQITDDQLLHVFQEMHSYLKARQQFPTLNCQRLLSLLRMCCSFLLDPRSRFGLFTERVGANWHQFLIEGHDSEGNKRQVSFYDGFQSFMNNISLDLANCLDGASSTLLVRLFSSFIQHPRIDIQLKFVVLNAENGVLRNVYEYYIWDAPATVIDQFVEVRKDFIWECISKCKDTQQAASAEIELSSLYNVYEYYVSWLIRKYIRANRFPDIMQLLDGEIEKCNDVVLGTSIIWNMITCNNQFLIRSRGTIEQKVAEFRHLIQPDKQDLIASALKFSPADIELKDYTVELGSYELGSVDLGNVKTIVCATIPLRARVPCSSVTLDDSTIIDLRSIANPLDDPIYRFLNSLGLNIDGMPLAFFSDVLQDAENTTLMIVTLNTFYHPDFDIVNGQIVHTNFAETEALLGRKYYPHKDKIISLLRALWERMPSEFPFEIAKQDVNINLISNYFVNYIDEYGKSFFHKVYALTTPDSFPKIRTRYLDKISRLTLNEEFLDTRDLNFESHIVSSSLLCEFVFRAMEIVVKKSIELRGAYRYLWADRSMSRPLTEPHAQPLIKSHVQPILEIKGIQISREVVAANGSLDYLCSFTKDDRLFKVGIELKNAHHPDLLQGLTSQLPAYLEDEGTQDGIFVVLWYKSENHPFPSGYSTIDELRSYLENSIPKKYHIRIMLIDCTKRPAPSRT